MFYPVDIRHAIISEKQSGKSLSQISQDRNISYSTVKRIWQVYQQHGKQGLIAQYSNCGPQRPKFYRMYRRSTWLKKRHPSWGAPFILTILAERYAHEVLPSERTLQKWFRTKGFNQPSIIREQQAVVKVEQVHDCWQMDAKENIILQDGTKACYLTTVDVKSGALLDAPVFSLWQN